ncbi:MAG: hypothetical protein U0414_36565 [Polyangiaceae bacterium]
MRGFAVAAALCLGCTSEPPPTSAGGAGGGGGGGGAPIVAEATFVDVPARHVTLHGESVDVAARARLFVNFRPAEDAPAERPIVVAFNGFATDIVHSFGIAPTTVDANGDVLPNPDRFTRFANVLFVDPRQAGFSYDVVDGPDGAPIAPTFEACSRRVFNEYVDAADVLFAVTRFLRERPALKGPVVWLGESYGGARVAWMLAFLRGRWDLAPYTDDALAAELAASPDAGRLVGAQLLLQPWVLGKVHQTAIAAACTHPDEIATVSSAVGEACTGDACACAKAHQRSPYNVALTITEQDARVAAAVKAHLDPAGFEALHGVPLASVAGLAATERAKGFKCDVADAETPAEPALVAALGPLPEGQRYYLPFNPLQPGKELDPAPADWNTVNLLGAAFVDNLRASPVLVTDGALDLVVPARALAPGLVALLGADAVSVAPSGDVTVTTLDGPRTIAVPKYAATGHMITMFEAHAFAEDARAFLEAH